MDAIFVGIDVSKDQLDVHVRPNGERFAVGRDGKGLEELIGRLRTLSPQLIAIEATGGFETIAAAAIAGAALPLVIVNPAQVRHFAQAVGKRAKTDPIDAEVIAFFAEAVKPEPRPLPDEQARLLAELVARRRQIIEMIVAERQREKRAENVRVRKSLTRTIKSLEKELPEIDGDIQFPGKSPGGLPFRARPANRAPCRSARTRHPEPARDRKPRWLGSLHPPVRPLEGQEHHWRRQDGVARRTLHGCPVGDPLQSNLEEFLSTSALGR